MSADQRDREIVALRAGTDCARSLTRSGALGSRRSPGKAKALAITARASVLRIGLHLTGAFDTPAGRRNRAELQCQREPDLKSS